MRIRVKCPPELKDLIPPPYPAKRHLPEWLKSMPERAFCEDIDEEIRTVKHCPPFIDAMGAGFIIPLPTDIHVHEETFKWDWQPPRSAELPYPRSPLLFHLNEQLTGSPFRPDDRPALKFINYWTIETDPGYSLLVTHPLNREDLPFRTLSGVVDTDRFQDCAVQFPALWTDPDFSGVLERGTPIAQCIAYQRDAVQIEVQSLEDESAERYRETVYALNNEPGVYRKKFRAPKP